MSGHAEHLLARVARNAEALAAAREQLDAVAHRLLAERQDLFRRLRELGVAQRVIGEAAGISEMVVSREVRAADRSERVG